MNNQPEQNRMEGLWEIKPVHKGFHIFTAEGISIGGWANPNDKPVVERIIAEHNACAGIANPAAIPKMVEMFASCVDDLHHGEGFPMTEEYAILADLRGEK